MVKITITPAQQDAINATGEHILVRGIPGSGKTFVLAKKVVGLLQENPDATLLFITYNNTLKHYITSLLEEFGCNPERVIVTTYHSWAKDTLTAIDVPVKSYPGVITQICNTVYDEMKKEDGAKHRFFKDNGNYDNPYKAFLVEEMAWLKGKGLLERAQYLKEKRKGRGVGLVEKDRAIVFDFVERVNAGLKKQSMMHGEDYANTVIAHIEAIKKRFTYDSIFIDEAQDLSQMQMKSLSKLLQKGQLCIAADLGQKIYKTDYTWKSAGVNVRGGRIKTLDIAHRSTSEIMELATSLLKHDPLIKEDDDLREYNTLQSGVLPVVIEATTPYETDTVKQLVKEILADDPEYKIGVLAFTNKSVENFVRQLSYDRSIPVAKIDKSGGDLKSPGVKVLTMHGAKGLEFDIVIITGLNDKFPMLWNCPEDELEERINTNRRLLYVSMTRAKEQLFLVYKGRQTRYISEMDATLYKKK